ncbi:phage protein [Streptococcus pneumoniae]|nr:phage protein [Streptococcus pneumoniae]
MTKYKKKPVVIEAIRFIGSNYEELREFIGENTLCSDLSIVISTLEGDMVAQKGDYIIKGVQGEFYPCKPDIFNATYEVVSEAFE